jgi:hypothetical protein
MCTTMSRLICIWWPTPFSTAKVCDSLPRHHRDVSDHSKIADTIIMATVHFPPPEVR